MYDNIIKTYELEQIRNIIKTIDILYNNDEIHIHITLIKTMNICPICNLNNYVVKDYYKQKIVHTISITRKTYIIYNKRRYWCKHCLKSFFKPDPFTSTNKGVSKLTVMNILDYLKDYNHTYQSAAKYFNLSISTIIDIFDKHVQPKRRQMPRVLSIDEVHIKSNTKHPYACVLLDFESNKIVDLIESRKKINLNDYFDGINQKELNNIEYVTMDLWSPYRDVIKRNMPKAKIIADSFHVVALLNKLLDKKRITVMNNYLNNSNNKELNYSNDFGYLLKKFSWLIRLGPNKIKHKLIYIHKYKFNVPSKQLLNHLLTSHPDLEIIYKLRNSYFDFNRNGAFEDAKERLDNFITLFRNHEIYELREYGKTLNNWKKEIYNSFEKHGDIRYSNGRLEGKNRAIKTVIRNSFGYTNFSRFRSRALYSINKDIAIKI